MEHHYLIIFHYHTLAIECKYVDNLSVDQIRELAYKYLEHHGASMATITEVKESIYNCSCSKEE